MIKLLRMTTCALVSAFFLAGCTSQTLPKERLPEFSVISVQLPGFKPKKGEQISWLTDVVIAGDFSADINDWAAKEVNARVEQALIDQGFTFDQSANSDYVLFAALIAGISDELMEDQERLLELIRLYPMLGGGGIYERNMLVLGLTTREKLGDGNPLWKAAVEIYSADELDLSKAARLQRLDFAINRLLSTLPDMTYTD